MDLQSVSLLVQIMNLYQLYGRVTLELPILYWVYQQFDLVYKAIAEIR